MSLDRHQLDKNARRNRTRRRTLAPWQERLGLEVGRFRGAHEVSDVEDNP